MRVSPINTRTNINKNNISFNGETNVVKNPVKSSVNQNNENFTERKERIYFVAGIMLFVATMSTIGYFMLRHTNTSHKKLSDEFQNTKQEMGIIRNSLRRLSRMFNIAEEEI